MPPFGFSCISQRCLVCQLVFIGSFFSSLWLSLFSLLIAAVCVTRRNIWVFCNGSGVCCLPLTSCVFRRRIPPLPWKHPYGSLPLAILLLPLRVRCNLVAVSSLIALSFPCFLAVLILMASSCAVIFLSTMSALAWYVYYAPNRNPAWNDFLDDLPSYIDLFLSTVICGDFNTVFDRSLDPSGSIVFDSSIESMQAMSALFVSCCVLDIWRYLHPQCKQFMWTKLDGFLSSRINYISCPYAWISSISSCDILSCPFSDHCAVIMSGFFPASIPRGPGIWKLNTSVLLLEDNVDLVSSF